MAQQPPLSALDIRTARLDRPELRARDFADQIGITEAALLDAHVGPRVTRITADPDRLMPAAERLGEVMALTRTPSCVHEKIGNYANYRSGEHAAMVLNDAIDLRIFARHWVHAFALDETTEKGPRRAIQVFDAAGDAVHKIHLRPGSNHDLWDDIVADLRLPDNPSSMILADRDIPEAPKVRPDRADELREHWDALTDTHQFVTMVSRLRMNRLGAYRVVGAPYVRPLDPRACGRLLESIAGSEVPVMVFVGNMGCIQIHSGPIVTVRPMGPWLNVMDPGFNLHLRGDHVAELWEVHKPTKRGRVTSVEAFDSEGRIIFQIFGTRKPEDRMAEFAELVERLPGVSSEVPA